MSMEAQEALLLINQLVAPKRLSYLEETLLVQTWQGKLYREIALDVGYELSYLRDVGAKLWDTLSDALGTTVTKKNIQVVLRQHSQRGVVSWNAVAQAQALVPSGHPNFSAQPSHPRAIQFPGRALEANSPLYIIRPPAEELLYDSILQPSSLTRIQGVRQIGKTSLLNRVLPKVAQAGVRMVYLNLRQVDQPTLQDLNRFLRWICWTMGEQLGLPDKIDAHWLPEIGAKISCTNYLERYLLQQVDQPIALIFDDMTRLMGYAKVAQDVLPMLRTWHEEAMVSQVWQRLRLVLVHSTEISIPLPMSQSPFNVGLEISLEDLDPDQVEELAHRSGWFDLGLNREDLSELSQWVEGHPYLLQLAFHWLSVRQMSLPQLLQDATKLHGIYSQHLRYYWLVLQQSPELQVALEQILHQGSQPIRIDAMVAEQLEGLGLIKQVGDRLLLRRLLYKRYFKEQLQSPQNPEERAP
jgi:hypothetical protein